MLGGLSCSGTQIVQLCTQNADCANAGSSYTSCCTFTQDGGSLSFCANSVIAGFGGGTCL